jgi:VRR-NUC domain
MIEHDLQKMCEDYLKDHDIEYYHSGFRGLHKKGVSKNKKGYPDLFIFIDSTVIFIELKTKTGILSPDQENKISRLESKGYKCYIVREWKQFIKVMESTSEGDKWKM